MEEWKQYRLGDIISISSGLAYKGEHLGKGDSFLLGMGCVSYTEQFLEKGMRKYDGAYDERYSLKAGDIVLATRQQSDNLPILGMPAIIPQKFHNQKMVFGTNLYKVNLNSPDFSNSFLYWLLKTPNYIHHIKSCQTGTTVRMITKANIEDYTFFCPEKSEREKICKFLWNIENKIALNRRINDNLEQQAQALFKSWFVDFEPFKDGKFVDSEMGMIPEGWKVVQLGEIIEISKRIINPQKNPDKIFYHYSLPACDNGLIPEIQSGKDIMSNKIILQNNTILFSKLNPRIKRIWFACDVLNDSICSTEFIPYRAKNERESVYIYSIINSDSFYASVLGCVNGATGSHQRFHAEDTLGLLFPYKKDIVDKYIDLVKPVLAEIHKLRIENKTLALTRDSLLPRLMSGELKFNDLNN